MKNKTLWVALIVVAIIAIIGLFTPIAKDFLGAVGSRFQNGLAVGTTTVVTQEKLTIGNQGTAVGNLLFGNCNIFASTTAARTISATTTATYDCQSAQPLGTFLSVGTAISGILYGDKVFLTQPTTTPTTAEGVNLLSAEASTTAGFIRVRFFNGTGADLVAATSTLNNWAYLIIR